MSWSGFKKNVGRATTQVMMKTGHVEKTADRGYEVEERRYRTLESASLRLQKEAKGYLDSLRAMTASQMRIAETIDAFYGDSGASDGVSRSYKQAVEDLDAETVKALDGPYRSVDIPRRHMYPSGKSRLYHYLANEESLQPYLVDNLTDGLDEDLIAEIESDYYSTKRRTDDGKRVVDIMDDYREEYELIDYLCRATVLEPINRFCAYFPDINECIKKRNHKMLDYDSMRSKVKRLTEKPDKDASKLPRAEKEADMVSMSDFLDEHRDYPPHASLAPTKKNMKKAARVSAVDPELASLKDIESVLDEELVMPAPSEHRRSLQRVPSKVASRLKRSSSAASGWSANLLARFAEVPSPTFNKSETPSTPTKVPKSAGSAAMASKASAASDSASSRDQSISIYPTQRPRADSKRSSITLVPSIISSESDNSALDGTGLGLRLDGGSVASSTDNLLTRERITSRSIIASSTRSFSRNTTSPMRSSARNTTGTPMRSVTSPANPHTPSKSTPPHHMMETPFGPLPISPVLYSDTFSINPRNTTPNPFFVPSELHEIMLPLKRAFLKQRADQVKQAKAAYEQLNEQLSTELPQLIDLRVPYLDPSFEALVKIQLRFCAEAYSRMAQVQQYLDPQTRDQYANGELDQRVEDVLGQIRELSIAGTV